MTITGFATTCPKCKATHDRPGSIRCETDGCRVVRFASSYEAKMKVRSTITTTYRPDLDQPCPTCGLHTTSASPAGATMYCDGTGCRVIEFLKGVVT